jgi:HAD superfamily hydrolase (TIGR01509 family)
VNLSCLESIIFDMDGLLVDSERLARESLVSTAAEFGLDPDLDLFTRMIGLPEDGSVRLLRAAYGDSFPAGRFIARAASDCITKLDAGHLGLKPGAAELIDWLDQSGLRKGVATSSSRAKATHTLSSVGVLDRFDVIVTRDDVARGKPHPDLFLRAALEMGVDSRRCLVLEDSYNGVRAAHAAGMRVVMVPDLLCANPEMCALSEAVVPSLFAVLDALAGAGLSTGAQEACLLPSGWASMVGARADPEE